MALFHSLWKSAPKDLTHLCLQAYPDIETGTRLQLKAQASAPACLMVGGESEPLAKRLGGLEAGSFFVGYISQKAPASSGSQKSNRGIILPRP